MEKVKNGSTIQSLQIGLNIIDLIAKQDKPIKFSEICEITQITKSNLYKYLNTLTQLGTLYRDKESGMYSLGSKLIEYGMAAINQENIVEKVSPYLQEMNIFCQNTVLLSVWTHTGPMIVRLFNSSIGLNIGAQIGTVLPISSATGKIFASFMDEKIIHNWKQQEFSKIGDNAKEIDLQKEIELVIERGMAFASEPLVPSISSISIPILNYKKQLLGAVTLVGFAHQIPKDINHEITQYLLKSSVELSRNFGYVVETPQ